MTGAQTGLGRSQRESVNNKTDKTDRQVKAEIWVIMWVKQRQVSKQVVILHTTGGLREINVKCPHTLTTGVMSHIPTPWWRLMKTE